MRRILFCCLVLLIADLQLAPARAQGYPSGGIPPITGSRTNHQALIRSARHPSEPCQNPRLSV